MNIGVETTGVFFPKDVETAADLSKKTGIPEKIIIEKFGLYEKHVADETMHASDLAIAAAKPILLQVDPQSIDVVIYFGSPHKDYYVWSSAPKIQHELGLKNAYAFEIMNVSSCFPIALKVAKDMLYSDNSIKNILLVGGCKESQIVDYDNPRSRFMFNFADGGSAALVKKEASNGEILGSGIITDGSFHEDVRIPAGGSKQVASYDTVENRQHYIDVINPNSMKERLDRVSIPNFDKVIREALRKSALTPKDIKVLLPLHTKRSMLIELIQGLGLEEEQVAYLDHYGHMSALDPCIGLHFANEQGKLQPGDIAVVVSAGTGYTWAATVIRW
ncbi:3-oxoacyl-ACP synthase [Bacillus albus]|uniref:3-oxoacyl-ACP synthase n=1 Tax=Bacillus cereus group TaxID=86661 RepID=UPI0022E15046|nr:MULTISPECIES: 3-oxoacyl-ACP synthase [Bacillus cereus group]MDA2026517.1 3-oxoacyl-ACP synthase [Bacillus cereus group sp. Bcc03]MDA2218441.1 3-oxoacyl-ACP synthase [Bacillus cereus group sp. Bc228]MDA2229868.1 3-oxoacyl-ACP synthase [Bacillus cereus group sp. Bc227]MDA2262519.1 3-oxoacyl-ACP synthase [Bacillus cereus group sp. Bc200]MDA2712035.1 3-oxoacyl-ACP synthase [Bacillus cereus group sp. Bc025]